MHFKESAGIGPTSEMLQVNDSSFERTASPGGRSAELKTLHYDVDGVPMASELSIAHRPRMPAIMLFPEAPGLDGLARRRAAELAELGFTVLACDIHGNGTLLRDAAAIDDRLRALRASPRTLRAIARGAFDALRAELSLDAASIAAIGYCIGGTLALELARSGAGISATVVFHGGLATHDDSEIPLHSRILVCTGADDPSIPPAQRMAFEAEMRRRRADWRMLVFGNTVHAFTNPLADRLERPEFARYDADAARRSWMEMLGLLDELAAGDSKMQYRDGESI